MYVTKEYQSRLLRFYLYSAIATIAILLLAPTAFCSTVWKNVQMSGSGCWVTGIVAQPKAPGLIYIRTDVGGCYRWDQQIGSWTPITDGFSLQQRDSYGCESIAVDPDNPDTVYIASGMWLKDQFNAAPGTIYKSINRGRTWSALGLKGVYMGANDDLRWGGERLALEPDNPKIILFGSRTQGLWRSIDGGKDWQQTALPFPKNGEIGVQSVCYSPNLPSTVYAAIETLGVYRSTDSGATWSSISSTLTTVRRLVVSQDGAVWVTYGNGVSKYKHDVWTDCTPKDRAADPYSGLAINPRDPNNVLVSYGLWGDPAPYALLETHDCGATWSSISANITTNIPWYRANNPNGVPPFDVSQIMFDPNKPKSVWFVSGGGIWNTRDITAAHPQFSHKESGHEELCVTALAAPPAGPELVAGVMDVDGFAFDNGVDRYPSKVFKINESWSNATESLAYEESNPLNMVRLGVQGALWNTACVVTNSTDGGFTWTEDRTFPHFNSPDNGRALVPLSAAMSPTDSKNVVVDVSDTDGSRWQWYYRKSGMEGWGPCVGLPAATSPMQGNINICADGAQSETFYAYVGGAVYRTRNGGILFEKMSDDTVGAPGGAGFSKIECEPGVMRDLWLSEDNDNPNYRGDSRPPWEGLYHSADAGRSWEKVPGISRAVTFSFGASGNDGVATLFVYGRRSGDTIDSIFVSTNLGKSWLSLHQNGEEIGDSPWEMAASRQTYGRVYIGTSGRGVFYNVSIPDSK